MFLALFVKKWYFCSLDLEMDFSTLKMTFNHENSTRNGLPSENEVLHMFLALFDKNGIFAYLTLKWTF